MGMAMRKVRFSGGELDEQELVLPSPLPQVYTQVYIVPYYRHRPDWRKSEFEITDEPTVKLTEYALCYADTTSNAPYYVERGLLEISGMRDMITWNLLELGRG